MSSLALLLGQQPTQFAAHDFARPRARDLLNQVNTSWYFIHGEERSAAHQQARRVHLMPWPLYEEGQWDFTKMLGCNTNHGAVDGQ